MIDVNVHVDRWPFRRLPLDEPPLLVRKLRELDVGQAWAASFDAILHKDLAAVNARLARTCRDDGGGVLVPFGAVNPMLPDWEEDVRRCAEVYRMPGVRLYPNYHGYTLDKPEFARLLELAARAKLLVQIVASIEDERTQHPLVRVPPVDVKPLPELIAKLPAARVMLLNAIRAPRSATLSLLAKVERVSFDTATLESVGGINDVLEQIPAERVVYGSHAPFFYPEAASLKMKEAALPADVAAKVLHENATALLK